MAFSAASICSVGGFAQALSNQERTLSWQHHESLINGFYPVMSGRARKSHLCIRNHLIYSGACFRFTFKSVTAWHLRNAVLPLASKSKHQFSSGRYWFFSSLKKTD